MAYNRLPSQQANSISESANAYPHPALNRLQSQPEVRRVAFFTVSLTGFVQLCVSYFRTLMWLVMTSKASIGRASINLWLCKVKCIIHDTSMHPTTIRHATNLTNYL